MNKDKGKKMGRRRKNKKRNKAALFVSFVILAAIISVSIFTLNIDKPMNSTNMKTFSITVPAGAGTDNIGKILEDNDIIKSRFNFKLLSKIKGNDGKYKAGVYELSPSMKISAIMDIIVAGDSTSYRFTIPEGLTLKETCDKLANQNLINGEAFMNEVENGNFDYKFMDMLPKGSNRLEGFLYPETYDVFSNANEHDVIKKMLNQFDKVVTDEHYKRAEELGYNMYNIVTIASIIEKETLVSSERPIVASVIYNRISANMPLQIDATVQYALPEHKERLTYADLKVDSPYNTYKNKGLPPGPICSPSVDSINAALYPETTDYLFYVLSPEKNGTHRFSNSYAEFEKNKAAYKASL